MVKQQQQDYSEESFLKLSDKIDDAKAKNHNTGSISTRGAGIGMRIATDMVAGVLVGTFLGYQADSYFETKPLWLIVFMVVGLGAGISNVVKTAKRMDEELKEEKKIKLKKHNK